ncbi:MAG TPA: transposase, partial [Candidatus Eisenbacteria bacterium]|nr:transposase [Candidatus Eisenbacteria bacterium]
MARRPRSELEDGLFHVTARAVDGTPLFAEDIDRLDFLGLLERAVRRFGWTCAAYCLMGTHYHVVLEARRMDLSAGMRWLNGTYAQRFNRRHERRGHLFGTRFSSWV